MAENQRCTLFTRGFVIREVKFFWWCIKLSKGTKLIIAFWMLALIVEIIGIAIRIHSYHDSKVTCKPKIIFFDDLCCLFGGRVNLFSVSYIFVSIISRAAIGVYGIYWWMKNFPLQQSEYFFYLFFVSTMYYSIWQFMLSFIQNDDNESIIFILIGGIGTAIYVFYLNSVIYSFVLQIDQEYRMHRKKDVLKQNTTRPNRYTILEESEL